MGPQGKDDVQPATEEVVRPAAAGEREASVALNPQDRAGAAAGRRAQGAQPLLRRCGPRERSGIWTDRQPFARSPTWSGQRSPSSTRTRPTWMQVSGT